MKRTHLLMGIPELHLDAFSPEAGRMKLYCGGGGGGGGDGGAAERAARQQIEEQNRRIAELEAAAAQRAAEQAAAQRAAEEAAAKAAADKAAADAAAKAAAEQAAAEAAKSQSDAAYAAQSPKLVAANATGKSSLTIDSGNPNGAARGRQGLGAPGNGMGLGI